MFFGGMPVVGMTPLFQCFFVDIFVASNVFVTPLTEMTNEVFGVERCYKSLVSLNQVSI